MKNICDLSTKIVKLCATFLRSGSLSNGEFDIFVHSVIEIAAITDRTLHS